MIESKRYPGVIARRHKLFVKVKMPGSGWKRIRTDSHVGEEKQAYDFRRATQRVLDAHGELGWSETATTSRHTRSAGSEIASESASSHGRTTIRACATTSCRCSERCHFRRCSLGMSTS